MVKAKGKAALGRGVVPVEEGTCLGDMLGRHFHLIDKEKDEKERVSPRAKAASRQGTSLFHAAATEQAGREGGMSAVPPPSSGVCMCVGVWEGMCGR